MGRKAFYSIKNIIVTLLVLFFVNIVVFTQSVPPPEEIIGFKVGADFHLASYQQALEYFKALEKASPMMKLFEIGKTSMGKPMICAVITSPENMSNLDRYKEISRKLALVKGLNDETARNLASEGRAIVYIDGGLHATEVAPAQHNIELAYDLLTSKNPNTKLILDNTILLLLFANPDGMDMVSEWYHPNVGTPDEISPMPWLYHIYAGHDNNRDTLMMNLVETQNITNLAYQEWFPQIFYNHHQTAPFPTRIWIPPMAEPTNPNCHPLMIRWQNQIGSAMAAAFEREKKPGVISRFRFDSWFPGYLDAIGDSHNMISIMTETALYRYATPHYYTVADFPEEYRDFLVSHFYTNPWKGGWWKLKDAVDYCLTASKAVLHTAAVYKEQLLYDRYWMGKDIIAHFQETPPYAWIIPQEQWDPPTAARLLNNMIALGIDVYKAKESFVFDGVSYAAGTWIIPMNQPFAYFVKAVFEEQNYPDLREYPHAWQSISGPRKFDSPPLGSHDVWGWTLSYMMGVKVAAANSRLDITLEHLKIVEPPSGKVESGAGYAYLISPKINNSFIAINRILKKGGKVQRTKDAFSTGGKEYPPGTYVVTANSVSKSFIDELAKELYLSIGGAGGNISAKSATLKNPRIALYKSWVASMDEGWTRWLFEQYEFPYKNIHDAHVKAGGLNNDFDVLVVPANSPKAIVEGHKTGTIPPQYAGGLGNKGINNIKSFVEDGGTLVLLNYSSLFAIDQLGLPLDNVLKELKTAEFICSGSLLKMNFDPKHPVAYGMPEVSAAVYARSPAFNIYPSFEQEKAPVVIAKYTKKDVLMSGYIIGEEYIQDKASIVEVPLGKGKVIILGFGVQHRAQPHATFKLLFNSLYYAVMK